MLLSVGHITDSYMAADEVIDSLLLETDTSGPVGYWDGGVAHTQEWAPKFKQGLAIVANENIFVHGARWWRPGLPDGGISDNDLTMYFGPNEFFEVATHSKVWLEPWDTTEPHWETMLFDEPIPVSSGEEVMVFMNVTEGANVMVARQAGYWTTPGTSRFGLYTTIDAPSGRFSNTGYVDDDDAMPGNTVDAWYWIDPLVTQAPPTPPDPTPAIEAFTMNEFGGQPATTPDGDGGLLVLFAVAASGATILAEGDVLPPSEDWTLESFDTIEVTGNDCASWVWTKPADPGDPSTFSLTWPVTYYGWWSSMVRVTHGAGVPVVDVVASVTDRDAVGTVPGFTTTSNDCLVIAFHGGDSGAPTSVPDGYTSIDSDASSALWSRIVAAAGTYDPETFTMSGGASFANHVIAFKAP